jgi:hypothetical protein
MKGFRLPAIASAYLTVAALVAVVDTVNVFTTIHDAAERGETLPFWMPAVWEYTSAVATLLCCPVIYAAVRFAPPNAKRWPAFVVAHVAASLIFSALHIVLMNAMRVAIYAALGRHYPFGEAGFWYEYRKDFLAYSVLGSIFWLFTNARTVAVGVGPTGARTLDIRDGKRLIRVPLDEIAAAHAAGNYVEFLLVDGRRPLARKPLRDALRELGDQGFVRTHRSWLVNVGHVRGLTAVGAGDFELELDIGVSVPLSRRFPGALARLKAPNERLVSVQFS